MSSTSPIPLKMRSLAVQSFRSPEDFSILELAVPQVRHPNDVLIKVYAASINPTDVALARGGSTQ